MDPSQNECKIVDRDVKQKTKPNSLLLNSTGRKKKIDKNSLKRNSSAYKSIIMLHVQVYKI